MEWALAPFLADARCSGLCIALAPGDPWWAQVAARLTPAHAARIRITAGGAERSHSVLNGLAALRPEAGQDDWVLVHDAARPCLPPEDLERLLATVASHPVGGLLAAKVADTIKREDSEHAVAETIDRSLLWRALTPQMFRLGTLAGALEQVHAQGRLPTDEAQAVEWLGARPLLVEGSPANIKVTSAADLTIAQALLQASLNGGHELGDAMRIGSGIDVHAFGPGEFVMLGGIRIPHTHGVVAHSDGDVILHALVDALLGAAGLGDIGQHFKDTDPKWRGADSKLFVRGALALIKERGLRVGNADVTVLGEKPRVGPYRDQIRQQVAQLLEVGAEDVNIKATTTEHLGFLGRSEGICAQATVLLVR